MNTSRDRLHGYHLLLDGAGVRRSNDDVRRFLARAVHATGLTKIADPLIIESRDQVIGFVVIAESHVSIHVRADVAFADVFSWRAFRWVKILEVAREIFDGSWRSDYFERSEQAWAPTGRIGR
jgi:hypothetical protein